MLLFFIFTRKEFFSSKKKNNFLIILRRRSTLSVCLLCKCLFKFYRFPSFDSQSSIISTLSCSSSSSMEAFRKQASKLREQVAKQQQAVLKQLGHFNNDVVVADGADEDEHQCHQQLQSLYNSTRAAKHLQRHIVRGVEGFISTSKKQMEIVKRLAEECCKYGNEYHIPGYALASASLHFGTSHKSMEGERESLLGIIGQVSEPLRTSIGGAPLDDARHLTHRYEQIRREVEAQAAEVTKRQFKSKEAGASSETAIRLQNAEARLTELRSTMTALGREATAAMLSVEDQQQQLTFQQLLTMVDAERSYHHAVADILEKLHAKMILEKEQVESASQSENRITYLHAQPEHPDTKPKEFADAEPANQEGTCFIAQVVHPFDAQADGELSLSVDDYVVVRQVTPDGWSEGECLGKAGWFPSAYVEKRDKAPASKVTEAT